jgi:uncharacterized protein (TIGR00369 family)
VTSPVNCGGAEDERKIVSHRPLMNVDEMREFLDREFPQINAGGEFYKVTRIEGGMAEVVLIPDERHLRPGGTISGPSLFALADLSAYVVILAHIGPVALAVTTNLNINFLRKPEADEQLVAQCRLLKLGKRLAIVEVAISDPRDGLVAHATATYSIPPREENARSDAVK